MKKTTMKYLKKFESTKSSDKDKIRDILSEFSDELNLEYNIGYKNDNEIAISNNIKLNLIMKYLKSFNESVTLSLGPLTNIESDKEVTDEEKEELLEIFKDWVDDRSIDMVNAPMTTKRGYFISDKFSQSFFVVRHRLADGTCVYIKTKRKLSGITPRTVITFYISFGMINSDSTNVDLIRNY